MCIDYQHEVDWDAFEYAPYLQEFLQIAYQGGHEFFTTKCMTSCGNLHLPEVKYVAHYNVRGFTITSDSSHGLAAKSAI